MILVNGDSCTGGRNDGLTSKYWPDYLQDKVNVPVLNLAFRGSSNDKIYRTTIEYLYSNPNPTCIIAGWSSCSRFELPTANREYLRITSNTSFGGNIPEDIRMTLQQLYYKHLHNDLENVKKLLIFILNLQEICRARNIQLLHFQSIENNFNYIKHTAFDLKKLNSDKENSHLIQLYNQIEPSTLIPDTLYNTLVNKENYPTLASGHVNDLGDARWAEIIYQKLVLK